MINCVLFRTQNAFSWYGQCAHDWSRSVWWTGVSANG